MDLRCKSQVEKIEGGGGGGVYCACGRKQDWQRAGGGSVVGCRGGAVEALVSEEIL